MTNLEPTPMGTCCVGCEDTCGSDHGCQNRNCSCHTAPPTPNTGTEWNGFESFDSFFAGLPMHKERDAMRLYEAYIADYIKKALATKKSQIIAEVEGMKVQVQELKDTGSFENAMRLALTSHGSKCYNLAIDAVITKLKGM